MNRITALFQQKQQQVLSIYFTAGYPDINSLSEIISALEESGTDIIEIGIPYSDPVADGPTIQHSNNKALENGMSVSLLLQLLEPIRYHCQLPLVLMGYLNPLLQYGFERFCRDAADCGIDGLIIPDMPLFEYQKTYQSSMNKYGLKCIFLITQQTNAERIQLIDEISEGFIYMVTSSSVTGNKIGFTEEQLQYMDKIKKMQLKNPVLAGFGITDKDDFDMVNTYVNGGIIGSRFIKALSAGTGNIQTNIKTFISSLRSCQDQHF